MELPRGKSHLPDTLPPPATDSIASPDTTHIPSTASGALRDLPMSLTTKDPKPSSSHTIHPCHTAPEKGTKLVFQESQTPREVDCF